MKKSILRVISLIVLCLIAFPCFAERIKDEYLILDEEECKIWRVEYYTPHEEILLELKELKRLIAKSEEEYFEGD